MESKLDQIIKKLSSNCAGHHKTIFLLYHPLSSEMTPGRTAKGKIFHLWLPELRKEPAAVPMQGEQLSCTGLGCDGPSIPLSCDLGFSDFIGTVLLHPDLDQSPVGVGALFPSVKLGVSVSLRSFPQNPCKQARGWRLLPLHFRCKTM